MIEPLQSITLNVPYDLSDEDWQKVAAVYRTLDGWIGDPPSWYGRYGDARYIEASVEPSGLLFDGRVEPELWTGWVTVLCARLSLALGREVYDACM
jgi:hypothetical protein